MKISKQDRKELIDMGKRSGKSVYLTGSMIAEMIRSINKKQEEKNNEKNLNS